VSLAALGADALSLSGHKIHGPRGAGVLVLAERVAAAVRGALPLGRTGGQELGIRGGTENTAAVVGMGVAAEQAVAKGPLARRACAAAHDALRAGMQTDHMAARGLRLLLPLPPAESSSASPSPPPADKCLTSVASILVPAGGPSAEAYADALAANGVFVGLGASCDARGGKEAPAQALLALGVAPAQAGRVLRLSFSRDTTVAEVQRALAVLTVVAAELEACPASVRVVAAPWSAPDPLSPPWTEAPEPTSPPPPVDPRHLPGENYDQRSHYLEMAAKLSQIDRGVRSVASKPVDACYESQRHRRRGDRPPARTAAPTIATAQMPEPERAPEEYAEWCSWG
jgi:hypothetical protein